MTFGRKSLEVSKPGDHRAVVSAASVQGDRSAAQMGGSGSQSRGQDAADDDWKHYAGMPDQPDAEQVLRMRKFLIIVMVICGVFTLDAMMSGTELITPINDYFLTYMRYTGGLLGLVLGLAIWRLTDGVPLWKGLIGVLMGALMAVVTFNGLAWRAANLWTFGFSGQAYETVYYPITEMDFGRKGRRDELSINPFKVGSSDMAVSEAQFETYWRDYDGMCVGVEQRKSASGAIQIKNDGVFTLREPGLRDIRPCSAVGVS